MDEQLEGIPSTKGSTRAHGQNEPSEPEALEGPQQPKMEAQRVSRLDSLIFHGVFFLFGLSALLPWNALLSSSDFWRVQFQGSAFQDTFESYFSAIFTTGNFLGAVWMTIWPPKFGRLKPGEGDSGDARFFTILGFLLVIAVLVVITVVSAGSDSLDPTALFASTILFAIIASGMTAVQQTDYFSLLSRFPPSLTQQLLIGQTVAAVAISIFQTVLSISLGSQNVENDAVERTLRISTVITFAAATVLTLAAFIPYVLLEKFPYYSRIGYIVAHTTRSRSLQVASTCGSSVPPQQVSSSLEETDELNHETSLLKKQPVLSDDVNVEAVPSHEEIRRLERTPIPGAGEADTLRHTPESEPSEKTRWLFIAWATKWQSIAILLVFFVTLSILSGINVRVKSICYGVRHEGNDVTPGDPGAPPLSDGCWYAPYFVTISVLMFGVGDLIGRMIIPAVLLKPFIKFPPLAPITAFVRLALHFTHALGFSNLAVGEYVPFGPPIAGDVGYWLMTLVLGIGNGNLASICLASYPIALANRQHEIRQSSTDRGPVEISDEKADFRRVLANVDLTAVLPKMGKYMAMIIFGGLSLGAWFGFAIKAMLCRCNPFI